MNNIYLSVNSDGNNSEGIGSMVQYQLFAYALAKSLNLKYAFFGFKNLEHYQNHIGYTQSMWCEKINNYFNFPNELDSDNLSVIKLNLQELFEYLNSNPKIDKNIVIDIRQWDLLRLNANLYKKYFFELSDRINHEVFLETNKNNISLHIRSRSKLDEVFEPVLNTDREFFDNNNIDYYKKILKKIDEQESKKEKIFHIHTQLSENELTSLKDGINSEFKYYCNDLPWNSLSCMIQSDILIAAKSSFSYIGHLLNKNKCLFRNNFWQSLYKETILLDNKGNF